jgi:acyl-coenzyme A synthetase/AMP-(fatty) acid ligase
MEDRETIADQVCLLVRVIILQIIIARHQQLTPVIPATQQAKIRRMVLEASPRQIVHETLS